MVPRFPDTVPHDGASSQQVDDGVRVEEIGHRPARSERRLTEPGFEALERELEQIVTRLEQGKVSLDEAIALWERGEELYKLCVGKLDAAQGKIEELAARVESAKPSA